jgi:hypothetical protein
MKFHKELLHAIIDHLHLIISHHPDSQQFITPQLEKDYKFEIRKGVNSKIKKIKNTDSFIKSMSRRLLGEDIVVSVLFSLSLSLHSRRVRCLVHSPHKPSPAQMYLRVWFFKFNVSKSSLFFNLVF